MEPQLSSSPPDLHGFALVSGLYGPGSWAGWFLCIIGSWTHLIVSHQNPHRRTRKLDANLWAYLAALNWAAADLIRHTATLRSLYDAASETEPWTKEVASVGAALTVVGWGSCHAHVQCCIAKYRNGDRKRALVLFLALLLPSASICIAGLRLGLWRPIATFSCMGVVEFPLYERDYDIIVLLPAFYWKGMGTGMQLFGLVFMFWAGVVWATASCCFVLRTVGVAVAPFVARLMALILAKMPRRPRKFLMSLKAPFLSWQSENVTYREPVVSFIWRMAVSVLYLVAGAWALGLSVIMTVIMVGSSFAYVLMGYLFGSGHSDACFFMPCAPQSLSDTDQAGALFVGLVLFVGLEIVAPSYAMLKRRYTDDESFRRTVDQRISAGVMGRVVGEFVGSVAEGNTPISAAARVNSGIQLEEGAVPSSRRGAGNTGVGW